MTILFTTPIFNFPSKGGPELRIENTIKALSNVANLIIYVRKEEFLISNKAKEFLSLYSKNIYYLDTKKSKEEMWNLLISINCINIIWFGFGNISFSLMKYLKSISNIPLVCDTDSVWSRFILRELDVENNDKKRLKILEQGRIKETEEDNFVNFCDVTTAVSQIDMEYYQNLANDKKRVHLFSNVVDLSFYENKKIKNIHNIKFPTLYLAGTFWEKSPMEDSTRWFINNVFPDLKMKYSNIKLYIVGRNSKEIVGDLQSENVIVTGEVESILPYLKYIDIVLVPLRFESGTRFKILEAMACKKPIVSTSLGAEGIQVSNKKDIFIADEVSDFYNCITKLLDNQILRKTFGENGYSLVKNNFGIEQLIIQAKNILDYLSSKND
ncbi:glycosyltransferase family 4 protein [Aliarcobacter cryaerophilus]|uniref:glycosyltransferase family 4 protein n=1 Tax=Aliarcobacter cryaerophilus TaxID=28198 RepID=UPI0021B5CCF2|nr:glycosyltransferase family 4 protein [Aliarcobacter cryaerophilus]MCT7486739.1 glycosyltransferase family 4 protein [Aliarcobacter cryaerophilus]MCT7490804.1 glycosyltransferase family 4 protein [Aliarcobacter cryaerophilus]